MTSLIVHKGAEEEVPIVISNHAEEKMQNRHFQKSIEKASEMVLNSIKHLEEEGYIWSAYRSYDYYEIRDFRPSNVCAFVVGFESDAEELTKFNYHDVPDQIIKIVTWYHQPKEFYLRTYNYKEIFVKKNKETLQTKETNIIVIEKNGNVSSPMTHSNFKRWFASQYPKVNLPNTKHSPYLRVRRNEFS